LFWVQSEHTIYSLLACGAQVCMSHALTTETEEIIGLLLGDVVDVGGQGKGEERLKARVWSVSLHRREQAVRSDDRVEISPEQLAAAAGEAERMSIELGIHTRVVGWYHSHPHLAVVPSHVDVRTQAQYQQLDSAFVGLIFSVFNSGRVVPGVPTGTQELGTGEAATTVSMNAHGSGRVQMTAFQSRAVNAEGQALPPLPPHSVSNWTQGAPADWPWNAQAGSPASYTHKEIGIEIVPEGQLLPDRRCLPCLTKLALLQNILREEERQAFLKSGAQFACFAGTRVQILTQKALLVGAHAHSSATGSSRSPADIVGGEGSAGTQFPCFTGTQVQIRTLRKCWTRIFRSRQYSYFGTS
jgi:proteasome lid subunit RPN8/RPN11